VLPASRYDGFIPDNHFVWRAGCQSIQWLATGWTIQGSNTGEGEIFRAPCRPAPRLTLYNGCQVFTGGKAQSMALTIHSPSAEVKERVELYLYPPHPSAHPWHVIRGNLPLILPTLYKVWFIRGSIIENCHNEALGSKRSLTFRHRASSI